MKQIWSFSTNFTHHCTSGLVTETRSLLLSTSTEEDHSSLLLEMIYIYSLQIGKTLTDLTLACEDHSRVEAYKLVLCAVKYRIMSPLMIKH